MIQSSGTQRGQVFKQGGAIEKGEHAKLSSFIGAVAVADLVKSTLGPKGMDKMLISAGPDSRDSVVVTNDGATILKKIPVDNPAAKILVNISMTQDDEVGDGTTSVVVLAGELLREAEKLTEQKLHPQTIIRGWRKALSIAVKTLNSSAVDNKSDPVKFRQDLLNVARTTLSSKIVVADLDFFANLCVDAVLRLKGSVDLDLIQIIKKPGGSMSDSFLDDGFILNKSFGLGQGTRFIKPKILLANTAMDTDKIKIFGARVKASSLTEIAEIEAAEKLKMKRKVDKIKEFKVDIFVNRQLIYDYPEQLFTEAGMATIEHADFDGVERLARVLDGEIMSVFDKVPGSEASADEKMSDAMMVAEETGKSRKKKSPIATCEKVETIMIGEDTVIKFSGVPRGEACSIVLRGASSHLLDEMERSLHDALCVLTQTVNHSEVVLGGGASEMMMAQAVEGVARITAGKEAMAIDAFAAALRKIPTILSDNAGFDSAELVANLRAAHSKGETRMGVDMKTGGIGDMSTLGVTESLKSKSQSLISAHEAAEMILRVDDVVKNAPRARRGH